jgi:hypothetical protein
MNVLLSFIKENVPCEGNQTQVHFKLEVLNETQQFHLYKYISKCIEKNCKNEKRKIKDGIRRQKNKEQLNSQPPTLSSQISNKPYNL